MKKKITIILSIIAVLAVSVTSAYLIDKNRMANNKPVVFSTWGAKYVPPVERENITHEIPKVQEVSKTISIPIREKEDLFIDLLAGWEYQIREEASDRYEYAIDFFTTDKNNKMTLYGYKELFGVCGTGLEIKDITLENGNVASVGYYDGNNRWTFINFGDNIVIQNEGLTEEGANEVLSMIKTMKFVKTHPGHIAVQ